MENLYIYMENIYIYIHAISHLSTWDEIWVIYGL